MYTRSYNKYIRDRFLCRPPPTALVRKEIMLYNYPMETIMKADIFFFISSIASVILTVLLCIMLYYFIRAGKNLYLLSEKLKTHFKESEEFVFDLKERLESNLIFRMFFSPAPKRKNKKAE